MPTGQWQDSPLGLSWSLFLCILLGMGIEWLNHQIYGRPRNGRNSLCWRSKEDPKSFRQAAAGFGPINSITHAEYVCWMGTGQQHVRKRLTAHETRPLAQCLLQLSHYEEQREGDAYPPTLSACKATPEPVRAPFQVSPKGAAVKRTCLREEEHHDRGGPSVPPESRSVWLERTEGT